MPDLADYTLPTLIEVMAPHCVECRAMQPDLDAVAQQHRDLVDFVVLDATRDADRVAELGVLGTPTLIAVQDGVEVARFIGRRSRSELSELFASVAAGQATEVSKVSRSDLTVWLTAGALLTGVGMLSGPAWILVIMGAGLAGYSLLRSVTA